MKYYLQQNIGKTKENILSPFATTKCLNSIEDFSYAQIDDLVISTMASLGLNLDSIALIKKEDNKTDEAGSAV